MAEPVVCADGQSYDRVAIERWLAEHNTSPTTGLALANRDLTPTHALRHAIDEWKLASWAAPEPEPEPWPAVHVLAGYVRDRLGLGQAGGQWLRLNRPSLCNHPRVNRQRLCTRAPRNQNRAGQVGTGPRWTWTGRCRRRAGSPLALASRSARRAAAAAAAAGVQLCGPWRG